MSEEHGVAGFDHFDFVLRAWEALLDGRAAQLLRGLPDGRRRAADSDPDAIFAAVGGYVAADGDWLRLPELRRRIRSWGGGSTTAASARPGPPTPAWAAEETWFSTIAGTLLILPEERAAVARYEQVRDLFAYWKGHHRPLGRPAARPPQAIAADRRSLVEAGAVHLQVRPAPRPKVAYRYVQIRPVPEKDFHRRLAAHLAGGVDQERKRSAATSAWVRVCPDEEVLRLMDDRQRQAHLAEALAEHHRQMPSFGSRHRQEFISHLRLGSVDHRGQRVIVGTTLYRAWKLATYCRVAQYLDVRYPGWRDPERWNILLPLGDGGRLDVVATEPLPGPAPGSASHLLERLPVPALWVALWDQWVEPFDCAFGELAPLVERGPILRGTMPENKGNSGVAAKFAALVELAAADIRPPLEAAPVRPIAQWTPAQRLFLTAVAVTVDYAEVAGELREALATKRPWRPPRQRILAPGSSPDPVGRAQAQEELRRQDDVRLDSLERRLRYHDSDVTIGDAAAKAAELHFGDADELHEWAVTLRRHPDRDARLDLTKKLLVPLTARVRDLSTDDAAIADIMNSVQMLSFDMSTLAPEETERLFLPMISSLSDGRGGPFVANVLRAIAIQHSKAHRYPDAQRWILRAQQWLDGRLADGRYRRSEDELKQLHDARQQVVLQATGLYLRITEWLLSHPKYATRGGYDRARALRRLSEFATHALASAGDAYQELGKIQYNYTLPSTKIKKRAATRAWVTNTSCMYMRALLLRATLHLVEADSGYLGADAQLDAQRSASALRDYVPFLYRETTTEVLPTTFVNELTRIALHYAFLTGHRFLPPGDPATLPAHLTRPVLGSTDGGSVGRLDLGAASAYLVAQGHDAGILASITYEPAKAVLQRNSIPAEVRDGPYGRRDRPLSYREWRNDTDVALQLVRRFSPGEFLRTTGLLGAQDVPRVPF
ncbi:hypothetical protein ACIBF5_00400 [Micromonospora sp. NPDC050417]|uniref:hypothetical protein n=1 Tax=Micromonospora sp. NPDC050417 TaxID=3364280 RepID=UPI0037959D44